MWGGFSPLSPPLRTPLITMYVHVTMSQVYERLTLAILFSNRGTNFGILLCFMLLYIIIGYTFTYFEIQ